MVMVFRQPDANIIETVDHMRAVLPELRAGCRQHGDEVLIDTTRTIRASVADVGSP